MQKIVISEFMDQEAVDFLAAQFDTIYDPSLVKDPARLMELVRDADALIVRNATQVRGELLDAGVNLKAIGRLGVGLDNIDCSACRARNIEVLPATGANDVSVAEYVIAGVLMLLRGSYFSTDAVRNGKWPRNALIGREAEGTTLGLVGFGNIARHVARRAVALGIRVIAFDPNMAPHHPAWSDHSVTSVSLADLLATADAISLHVPLVESTRNLIDAAAIETMKDGAVLINTARGGVIDDAAVAGALITGKLGGAMIDVFPQEPLPVENPYHGVPNLILTPHIAGVTNESNVRVSAVTAENVMRVLAARA
ncbi:hydroxyacid dehydrogenase [Burkholderia multivorans]|uniref:hydroxyacid dehydrogenase n=1 Tax=Burkholderia multivorans TaxID=87883 RepID=UPI001C219953|nr:hydroxyacid dehydrogenase [Burkholderia multivorans]MBU9200027.1 hydroxyacid dehydrogenase [Burkholderia multivorans]